MIALGCELQRKVVSGARDVERRLVMNHGDNPDVLSQEMGPDEAAIVIALGCEVRETSGDPNNVDYHVGHCCYGAAMEMVVGGDHIDLSSHGCRC